MDYLSKRANPGLVGFDLSLALLTRENARATGHDANLLIVKVQARTDRSTLIDLARRERTLRDESRG